MSDPIVLAGVCFIVLLALLAGGLWVAVALALVGVAGFLFSMGNASVTGMVPASVINSFILTAVPLFIFMGEILVHCGVSDMLYRAASRWLAWAPGGLLHSNIGSCAFFAAISGSSPATAATIGTVALPALRKRGYDERLTLGSLAAGGTLGILIPPSISLIIYGSLADASVGKLFAGGIIPGIVISLMFISYIAIRTVRNPRLAPREGALSAKGLISGLKDIWPIVLLMFIVLGGIFGGIMTPTEAAAIGCSVALIMALGLRRLSWQILKKSLLSALEVSCMCLFIVVGASILSTYFAMMRIPVAFAELATGGGLPPVVVLLLIYSLYLLLGCFIDGMSAMVLTVPTVVPVIVALGYDPIWFGVVLTVLIEVGMLTPPMGINLFVIHGISGGSLTEVIAGSAPFFLIILASIALFTVLPSLVLWLPSLMGV